MRTERNISLRLLYYADQYKKDLAADRERKLLESRYLPGRINEPSATAVWDQSVDIYVAGTPITYIEINNPKLALTYQIHFDALWKIGKK